MPTFKLEEMDENQPYGGDNDMYFRQWRLPSMKPVLDEKLDRDFLENLAKKDEMMRKRAERRQKHSEKYDKKFQNLVKQMSEASVEDSKVPKDPVFRKGTEAEMRRAREDLEREFASPSSTAKMVPFTANIRPRPNPIFGEKMVSLKSLILPTATTSSRESRDSSTTTNTNFGAHETVFYPQTHDSFNLDHYNGSRPSFAFSGIQGATSTPVSGKTGGHFFTGIPEEIDGDDSVFESSKYVTAMESPIGGIQKTSGGIQKSREEEERIQKAQKALDEETRIQKAKEEQERIQKALDEEKKLQKAQKAQEEALRIQKALEAKEESEAARKSLEDVGKKKTQAFGSIFGQKLSQMEQQNPGINPSATAPRATEPPLISSIFTKNAPGTTDSTDKRPPTSSIFGIQKTSGLQQPSESIFGVQKTSNLENDPSRPMGASGAFGVQMTSPILNPGIQKPSGSIFGIQKSPESQTTSPQNPGLQKPMGASGAIQNPSGSIFGIQKTSELQKSPESQTTVPLLNPSLQKSSGSIFGIQKTSNLENDPTKPMGASGVQMTSPPQNPGLQKTSNPEEAPQKAPTRPFALFKNYIALLKTLLDDKKTFETTSEPQFRALLKRTITEKVTVFTERQTSSEARGEILEFFKTMLQKKEVRGFAVVGEAPRIQLEKDDEVNYAVHCIVEKYISLAELDEELAPTISDLISRLSAVIRRVEKVFIVLMFNKSTLLRQNPQECQRKFVDHVTAENSDEKAREWNQEQALGVLFFTVFAKNALISTKGRKMVLTDELLWKYVETSIAHVLEVPKASFVLLQLITTCKPRLHLDEDRWYDMLATIDSEILPELETDPFPGDEAVISQLAQMVAHLME